MTEQIEDTAKAKITQEKSQPRDQANRNSPDSRSHGTVDGLAQRHPTVQNVLKNVEIQQVQLRQVPTVRVPHVLHKDMFVNQRIVAYRQVHTDSNRQKAEEAPHVQFFDQVEKVPEI